MLAQEVHSKWCLGLQAHRWGRLEEPAGDTWVAMHRASDVGVGTLFDPHKPTDASAELVQNARQSDQAGSGIAMTTLQT